MWSRSIPVSWPIADRPVIFLDIPCTHQLVRVNWHKQEPAQVSQNYDGNVRVSLGKVSWEKTAVLLDFVQITSRPPHFGQLVQLFSDVEIQDLKVSLELKYYMYYIMFYIYNLKTV